MSTNSMSRRRFLQLSGVTLGGAVLVACAPPQAETGGGAPGAEEVTISFMGWGGPGEDEGVRNAIAVFEEEKPEHQGDWLHTPENYQEKFLANVAAGTPPDTAFIGSGDFGTYVRDGLLLDITDQLETRSAPGRGGLLH